MATEFFENELHLYAINGEKGAGWNFKKEKWVPVSPDRALTTFLDGVKLTKAEAKKMFPDADVDGAPDLK